jgi:hypothetical protein
VRGRPTPNLVGGRRPAEADPTVVTKRNGAGRPVAFDASLTLVNHSWDVAAGAILAREAGARVLDHDGSEHTTASSATIAAGPGLCDELLSMLRSLPIARETDVNP